MGYGCWPIYGVIYIAFIVINVVRPKTMGVIVVGGLNLAIIYGFALIVIAVILALVYNSLSHETREDTREREEGLTWQEVKSLAVIIFLVIVGIVLFVSFYSARRSRSASGYYAAGGRIHWGVNGIAFAGDYLSAASFLGICGLIAVSGYDGFLYSIGYLAGWVVALFVVAEPLRRLGRYTFTDALDSKFNKRSVKLMAAIATLMVSIFYLIPQMVGAGVLVQPLLGFPQWAGVVIVGFIVITIVTTAGMTSTTYVQFIKGSLLILFALIIVIALLVRGFSTAPDQGGRVPFYHYKTITATDTGGQIAPDDAAYKVVGQQTANIKGKDVTFVETDNNGALTWWKAEEADSAIALHETQSVVTQPDGTKLINGAPEAKDNQLREVSHMTSIAGDLDTETGPVNPFKFLALIGDKETVIDLWKSASFTFEDQSVTVYYASPTPGEAIVRPGQSFKLEGSISGRIDFISLMIALFLGTAALPHILIRYYTVPSQRAARKSTVVAIMAIGFFYILTLYLGLGAMTSSTVNPADNNMSAPLLAESFGTFLFAMISAIAFATVLGTVSGLDHRRLRRGRPRPHGPLRRSHQERATEGLRRTDSRFGGGCHRDPAGDRLPGDQRVLPGRACLCRRSIGEPSLHHHDALLEANDIEGHGRLHNRRDSFGHRYHLVLADSVGTLRPNPADAPFPLKNPGIISIPLSFLAIYVVSKLTKPDMLAEDDHGKHHDVPSKRGGCGNRIRRVRAELEREGGSDRPPAFFFLNCRGRLRRLQLRQPRDSATDGHGPDLHRRPACARAEEEAAGC